MVIRNEEDVKFIDMTSDVQRDTFVNNDYRKAEINNIGRYLESKDKDKLRARAEKELALID